MSEAIWLSGTSLSLYSRETQRAWLDRFLSESAIRPKWISAVHIIQPGKVKINSVWNLPIVPFTWIGGCSQSHFILAALCRELRAGEHELALMLEKDHSGWNAALLATPAFFGSRNRIPAVMVAETRVFPQPRPDARRLEQTQFLEKSSLPLLPEAISSSPAAWLNGVTWSEATGLVRALNAASGILPKGNSTHSAVCSAASGEPIVITLLEGL
jgi:hypothetical protein